MNKLTFMDVYINYLVQEYSTYICNNNDLNLLDWLSAQILIMGYRDDLNKQRRLM